MRHIFFLLKESAANEEKLTHLEHAEDHPINAGADGLKHTMNTLSAVHKTLTGQQGGAALMTKYDGCVSGNTEILLPDGSYKTIEQITTQWSLASPVEVVGWDFDIGQPATVDVLDKNVAVIEKDWVVVDTDDGSITCTYDHEIFVEGKGWVQAGKLCEEDVLKSIKL